MHEELVERAIRRAQAWVEKANTIETAEDTRFGEKIKTMLEHPQDKLLFMEMLDQSFRAQNPKRAINQLRHILDSYDEASFLSGLEKLLMAALYRFGPIAPALAVREVIKYIRKETATVVIHGEKEPFHRFLEKRKNEGVQSNVNFIGEAVLGEEEARRRMDKYIAALKGDDVTYISVKISTIFSQIDSLAYEWTLENLESRLTELYRVAKANGNKFVNLDMEEYRDLDLTFDAFVRTLDKPEFHDYHAGIVLQAYLPDTYLWQKRLTEWAMERVKKGGAPIKIRLVKGANMEMEECEASIEGWEMVTYDEKSHTDANYKKMLDYAFEPRHAEAVHVGVASHNLFDIAYAYELAVKNGIDDKIIFEMLEGIADASARVIKETHGEILLYAPTAAKEEFVNAIAYLVRRLDENTAPENFLRHAFGLKAGTEAWSLLKEIFERSCRQKDDVLEGPKRKQDRSNETYTDLSTLTHDSFTNEPGTDWSLTQNREWAETIVEAWDFQKRDALKLPIVLDGTEIYDRETVTAYDHSYTDQKVLVGTFPLATPEDVEHAVSIAKADPEGWRQSPLEARHALISKAAQKLREARGDLLGIAAAETGKVFKECDLEISEAIDFAEFYPYSVRKLEALQTLKMSPKGVGVVITPWNFPVAIPAGGIITALATGNTVIIKPATAAAMTAYRMCQCFWDAGISKKVLQFLPARGEDGGARLSSHKDVDFVIFTGGTDAAMRILQANPRVHLSAETGGKNATIVTAMSDRDMAIKNVLHSAFGNVGQKCSATSLLILEAEVYDDPSFKKTLVDAARSMPVGSPWQLQSRIGPLIAPPKGALKEGMDHLDPGEKWVLEPGFIDNNPYMMTPGIKWDVKPGNYCHTHELFGPVLAVMRADDLDHAIEMVNATGFGLTSGIESLDEREHEIWKARIKAGNLYINRSTTGAIVLRQPFGGMGKSAIGAGIKAGGWNYVTQFMDFEELGQEQAEPLPDSPLGRMLKKLPDELLAAEELSMHRLARAIASYERNFAEHFVREIDYVNLRGESNTLRYLPRPSVLIRIDRRDSLFDILARIAAVKIVGIKKVTVSLEKEKSEAMEAVGLLLTDLLDDTDRVLTQGDDEVAAMLGSIDALRYAHETRVPDSIAREAAKLGRHIHADAPLIEGRVELLNYFVEQSVTHRYHRYGNLGKRGHKT